MVDTSTMETRRPPISQNNEFEGHDEDGPYESGVYWTPELNIEFIRMRKTYGELFCKGSRRGSLTKEGWRQLIAAMNLEGKLSVEQGKKRWQNFLMKYKTEKEPTRLGKPADTPVTWPLFHMMDWAVGDTLDKSAAPSTQPAGGHEAASAVPGIPPHFLQQAAPHHAGYGMSGMQHLASVSAMLRQASSDQPRQSHSKVNPSQYPPTSSSTSRAPKPTSHPYVTTGSVHPSHLHASAGESQRAAPQGNELNCIRSSLNDLAELQAEKCNNMRRKATGSVKTLSALQKLVESSERQAKAFERFADVLKTVEGDETNVQSIQFVLPD